MPHEMLSVTKEVGGLKKFKDLLDAIGTGESITVGFQGSRHTACADYNSCDTYSLAGPWHTPPALVHFSFRFNLPSLSFRNCLISSAKARSRSHCST